MRRRRPVVDGSRRPLAAPAAASVVALAGWVVAAAVAARTPAVRPDASPTTTDSVMYNVSAMIERLLDNYDMRLRPQFGGRNCQRLAGNGPIQNLLVGVCFSERELTMYCRPSVCLSSQSSVCLSSVGNVRASYSAG